MQKELAEQMCHIQEIIRRLNIGLSDNNSEVTKQYGYLKFEENELDSISRLSQYIRLPLQTNPKTVVEFMQYGWCLPTPNLIISVIGGGKQYHVSTHLRKAFQRGLAVAAATTNAWLITTGRNTGVVKEVGEALNKYRYKNRTDVLDVPCIGICTWNDTVGNERLDSLTMESAIAKNSDMDKAHKSLKFNRRDRTDDSIQLVRLNVADEHDVRSYVTEEPELDGWDLEPNHTHFLLFDDNSSYIDTLLLQRVNIAKYSRRINMEASSEDVPIPLVMILLEGGLLSIRTVCQALQSNIPLVVVRGSGRAADLLADLYVFFSREETAEYKTEFVKDENPHSFTHFNEIELNSIFERSRANNNAWVDEIQHDLCEVFRHRKQCVVIFEFESERHGGNLEDAILEALFKATKFSGDHSDEQQCRVAEFKLALVWQKFHYAQKHILNDTTISKWSETDLCQVLVDALDRGDVDFIELILNYGEFLEKLTANYLEQLYVSSDINNGLPLRKKSKEDLSTRDAYYSCYFADQSDSSWIVLDRNLPLGQNAAREFFLWAIFSDRFELGKYLCSKTWNQSIAPLIAARIYRLASTMALHRETQERYKMNAFEFDSCARSIIDQCYENNRDLAIELLKQPAAAFDNVVPLKLAERTKCRAFLASKCVQKHLDQKWFGHINYQRPAIHMHIFLCSLFLPLLPFFSIFLPYVYEHQQMTDSNKNHRKNRHHGRIRSVIRSDQDDYIQWSKKVIYFYRAPIVRFCYNVIFFVLFLGLFSFVLINEYLPLNVYLKKHPGIKNLPLPITEIVLHLCLWSLVVEELRQFSMQEHQEYFSNVWNLADVAAIVLYLVAFITRFIMIETFFIISKIVFCLDLIMWFVGTLHLFAAFERLGPKLSMIFNTMKDLFFFICFILIFLFAFSITSWSLINSGSKVQWIYSDDGQILNVTVSIGGNNSWTWGLLRDITQHGVWKIFGQVDPIEGTDSYSNMAFVLTIIFVAIANVLLLNVLIALFNFTIQNVQQQSHDLWRYQRFLLVNEFSKKTPLPPPLNIIYYIFISIRFLVVRIKSYRNQHRLLDGETPLKNIKTANHSIKQQFKISDVMRWEAGIAEEYWHDTLKHHKNDRMESALQNIEQNIDHLASCIHDNNKCTPIYHQSDKQIIVQSSI